MKENKAEQSDENEDILESIGEPGRYQWILLFTICWCHISSVMQICFMVFGDVKPSWKCANGSSESSIDGQNCTNESPFLSVTSQFDLIGDLSYVPALMSSLQLIGALLGSLIVGQLADMFGRKRLALITVGCTAVLGLASGFSPNWQSMTAFRFVIGIFSGGYESVAVVYLLEGISRNRLFFEATIDASNSIGFAWLALVAWLTADWKYLSFVAGLQVIPAFFVLLWAEETPRWLYQRGRIFAANAAIAKIARVNNAIVEPLHSSSDSDEILKETFADKSLCKRFRLSNSAELFRTKQSVKYLLMLMFSFFVTGLVGYGLIFNVTNLLGNIFVNFAVQGLLNMIPAVLVSLIERFSRFGRRLVHQTSLIGVAICLGFVIVLMALNLQLEQFELLDAACLIGSMFSFPLWVVCNVYSAELFPTQVRNMANGLGNMSAKIGGVIAPQLVSYFFQFWNLLPFVVMTVLCLLNSVFAFLWLPESKGKALAQSVDHIG